jgi:uncharacterized protein (TIGR03000 family)
MIPRLLAVLLLIPALAGAEDNVVFPSPSSAPIVEPIVGPIVGPEVGPVVVGPVIGPVVGPYGPYWCPRHWIYDYMPAYDSRTDRYGIGNAYLDRRYDNPRDLKSYPGRSTLDPAVPYSDYLAQQRRLQAATPPPPAASTPSADRAILEFVLPTESARLLLDGKMLDGDGKTRSFQTPPLVAGQEYKFAVKVTWPSDNPFEDHSKEQIVTFRAGDKKTIEIRAKN